MGIKKIFAAAAIASIAALTACGNEIKKADVDIKLSSADSSSADSDSMGDISPDDSSSAEKEAKVFDEAVIVPEPVNYVKFSATAEAEDGKLGGATTVLSDRKDFTGKGYVTEIVNAEDWSVEIELPESQFYNVSVTTRSEVPCKNVLMGNGAKLMNVASGGSGDFETTIIKNVYLEKGTLTINLDPIDAGLDIDRVSVAASAEVSVFKQSLDSPALSNAKASDSAKALYSLLCSTYGKKILLGQYDTVGTNAETDVIYETTGKYPAIRFGDLMCVTDDETANKAELECAKEWYADGGIVGYMWHWKSPSKKSGFLSSESDFDIMKAKTAEDISMMEAADIKKLADEKKISAECLALVNDIDKAAESLKVLRDEGIPVLWRPLHEASNAAFWWGKDKDSYIWLWQLMYKRMTAYHGLDNLIWVWSAQNADWYVSDKMCDIVSADVYSQNKRSGQIMIMLFLNSICQTKPIVMSECGSFPDIQSIANEGAFWGYIGHWGGDYLLGESGKLDETHDTADELVRMYNNNFTLTRDKLEALLGTPKKEKAEDISAAAQQ